MFMAYHGKRLQVINPHLRGRRVGNNLDERPLVKPDWYLNPNFPVINRQVEHKRDAYDDSATKAVKIIKRKTTHIIASWDSNPSLLVNGDQVKRDYNALGRSSTISGTPPPGTSSVVEGVLRGTPPPGTSSVVEGVLRVGVLRETPPPGTSNVVKGVLRGTPPPGTCSVVEGVLRGTPPPGTSNVVKGVLRGMTPPGTRSVVEGVLRGTPPPGTSSVVEGVLRGTPFPGTSSVVEGVLRGMTPPGTSSVVEGVLRGMTPPRTRSVVEGVLRETPPPGTISVVEGVLRRMTPPGTRSVVEGVLRETPPPGTISVVEALVAISRSYTHGTMPSTKLTALLPLVPMSRIDPRIPELLPSSSVPSWMFCPPSPIPLRILLPLSPLSFEHPATQRHTHTAKWSYLLYDFTEGKVEGKRSLGRWRIQILDDLKERRTFWG
uniref:Uncharacterized protein n=1 Tax=Timema cristinae TaxID=61476 RepID=A0A7R9CV30_TIMCR|nr:unnamed protein product [Timema cristinae]